MAIQKDDFTELQDLAMAHLEEAVRYATITLEDGSKLTLKSTDVIRVCQELANMKLKKQKIVSKPEDFVLHTTAGDLDEDND